MKLAEKLVHPYYRMRSKWKTIRSICGERYHDMTIPVQDKVESAVMGALEFPGSGCAKRFINVDLLEREA